MKKIYKLFILTTLLCCGISFATPCRATVTVLPWSENFDAIASDIAAGWDRSGSTTPTLSENPGYIWGVAIAKTGSSNKMLRFFNSHTKVGTAVINTPQIVLPASPAYEFDFEYSHHASCGAFTVKVSEDGGTNWTALQSYEKEQGDTKEVPSDQLIEASIDLTSYAGKTIMLQFFANADYSSGAIFVDNVAVRLKSTCPVPRDVTVSAVRATTAKVAWIEKGTATAWKLQTSTDGENWGEEIEATTNPFTLTGLTAETTYYVRVKSACDATYTDWSDPSEAFTTQCAAQDMPIATEGFDAIPSCWSVDPEWALCTDNGHSNSTSIRVNSFTANLRMPLIVLSEKAQLSFWHSAGYNNSVKYCVFVDDGESEVKVEEQYSSTTWQQATVDLSAYTGKTVNIIFRSTSSSYYLYLDDVAVNYLPVAVPTNVEATSDDESVIVAWECNEATTYTVRYRTNGEGEWTEVTDLSAKTYTIESLTNGTAYEVQVKAIVSSNRQSDWSASTVVTPAKCPTPVSIELSEKTFNSVKVSWTASGAGTWVLEYGLNTPYTIVENLAVTEYVLDNLTPGANYTIKVISTCSGDELNTTYKPLYTAPTNVVVTSISDVTASASWDPVADMTGGYKYAVVPRGTEAGFWGTAKTTNETSVELSGLDAGTEYDFHVVSLYPGQQSEYTMSPDVKVEFATITIAPKNLTVSEITNNSAELDWEYDGGATKYEYALGNDPTALEWTEVAEKTKTLTELAANTSFTFYVRAKYSNTVSDSINITFRTDCNAIAELPWFEGFEDMAVGNYLSPAPDCWAQLHVNNGLPYAYVNTYADYVKTGSKSMNVVSSNWVDGYLILPEFAAALNGLQITFWHKEMSAESSVILTLGYITDISNAETFVAIKTFGRKNEWQEEANISLSTIPSEVANTARLAFKLGYGTSDSFYTGIDDITVSTSTATGLEQIDGGAKAIKVIKDGVLCIIHDGKTYTVTGAEVR